MAEIIRLRGSPHDEVQELLPWLVNGTLAADEVARVEAHLAGCAECRAELDAERRLSMEVASLPIDADAAWEAMERRITAEPSIRVHPSRSLWRKRVPLGWAVASPFAAAAAVALVLVNVGTTRPLDQQYRALGAAEMAQTANLVVQFEPKAQVRDMQAVLSGVNARLVDGPTDTGAYLLRVDQGKRELALKRLRDNDMIALAEPIDGASRP
jgi:anti-sigma factor RsiW